MVTTERVPTPSGVDLAVHRFGGEGPPVMLVHATGFHGMCWEPLARRLRPAFTVWALDLRGHGSSGKAPDGRYDNWDGYAEDVLAAITGLSGTGWAGLGHSLGGAALLMAEADRPGTFSALCCYEPVVFPPDVTSEKGGSQGVHLADLARRRRPSFESRAAAAANYRSKPPFNRFDPDVLAAYVEHGFIDEPDGTVTLACARDDEAAVFEGATRSGAWSMLPDVRCPVTVLAGSDPADAVGRAAEPVARRLPRAGFRRLEDLDHFGPMVDPGRVAALAAVAFGGGGDRSTIGVTPPG